MNENNFTEDDKTLISMVNIFYKHIINTYLIIEKETHKIFRPINFDDVYNRYIELLNANDLFAKEMYALKNENNLKKSLFIANEYFVELLEKEINLTKRLKDKANGLNFSKKEFSLLANEKNNARDIVEQKLNVLNIELQKFVSGD